MINTQIGAIREAMLDEESRLLMDARLAYMDEEDEFLFYKRVDSLVNKEWHCREIEDFRKGREEKGIIIFGCGHDGKSIKRILGLCHIPLRFFCDSDGGKVGTRVEEIPVISVDEVMEKHKECLILLGSRQFEGEMRKTLLDGGFAEGQILRPKSLVFQACTGKQYFDVFKPQEQEVFIDAGAYVGDTVRDFVDWTCGKYRKIISLEPSRELCETIKRQCMEKHIERIQVVEAAAWNENGNLLFTERTYGGSRVNEDGEIHIKGMKLDSVAGDEPVTFIKMDIEGSELKALEGAETIIRRYKPRLAICIYHKPEDIVEIPGYLLKIVPEYRFYIRHYTSDMCETVLYAAVGSRAIAQQF